GRPVRLEHRASRRALHRMAGRNATDVAIECRAAVVVLTEDECGKVPLVDGRCRCGRAQPPKGARECNGAVTAVATVERAHAHQVPCGEELAAAPIANDEREVAHE